MRPIIQVEKLSKVYQLGSFGTGTLARDMERFWARLKGKEDPFQKIGEENDRAVSGQSDIVWSLKDVSFEVKAGETVGVIGKNGAGKSTLLKIISRVTSPSSGSFRLKGRVASLLEVGTGFHPELTGRENIFLNAAILGMRKAETKRRFDEIVDFAAVQRYIDTPVKRYSTGMYVRLAFAIAAHLESEILIVDEVLAVGDAEFQKKCLGKMGEVSKSDGRTVLFVSHNMASIQTLCSRVISLSRGQKVFDGEVQAGINHYYESVSQAASRIFYERDEPDTSNKSGFVFTKVTLDSVSATGEELVFLVEMLAADNYTDVSVGLVISDENHQLITTFFTRHNLKRFSVKSGRNHFTCRVPKLSLIPGTYWVSIWSSKEGTITSDYVENAFKINVDQGDYYGSGFIPNMRAHGSICLNNSWTHTF